MIYKKPKVSPYIVHPEIHDPYKEIGFVYWLNKKYGHKSFKVERLPHKDGEFYDHTSVPAEYRPHYTYKTRLTPQAHELRGVSFSAFIFMVEDILETADTMRKNPLNAVFDPIGIEFPPFKLPLNLSLADGSPVNITTGNPVYFMLHRPYGSGRFTATTDIARNLPNAQRNVETIVVGPKTFETMLRIYHTEYLGGSDGTNT